VTTGIEEAMLTAGIPVLDVFVYEPGIRPVPLTTGTLIDEEYYSGAECICLVSYDPDAPSGEVQCQSICQRVATPNIIDLRVLLVGEGVWDWDDTNSGFSVDGGTNWYALDPETGDEEQDSLTGILVDGQTPWTMVLDMDSHIDDFTAQDVIDFQLTFNIT
jgi:hypothetical protein